MQIAAIAQKIRGYGHVKEASLAPAKAEEEALWGRWEKQGDPPDGPPRGADRGPSPT